MKNIKKIISIALSSLLIITGLMVFLPKTEAADPATIVLKSIYAPERAAIEYVIGKTEGLSFSSFNSFYNNPNILGKVYATFKEGTNTLIHDGDERTFTSGRNVTQNAESLYTDTIGVNSPIKNGDKLKFSIYFHNNGSDPYNNIHDNNDKTIARNVEIGIDVSDIHKVLASDYYKNIIRPVGYIKSVDNFYDNLVSSPGEKKQNQKITDTVQAFYDPSLDSSEISLKIIPKSARLYVKEALPNFDTVKAIDKTTNISFKTETGDKSITVTPSNSADLKKIWITLTTLPGCFRYSGFAYFEAEVVIEEPEPLPTYCTSLTLTKQTQQTCNPNEKFTVFSAKVNFTDENVPAEQYLVFDSTDKKAKLTLNPPNQGTIMTFPSAPQKVIGQFIMGMYDGIGTIKVTYTDSKGTPIEGLVAEEGTGNIYPGFCKGSIPTCTDDCVDICVQHPVDIPAGSLSEFSAEATGYYGNTWSGQIEYYVEKGKGKFYKGTKEAVIAQIKKDFPNSNPYDNPNAILGCNNLINIVITPQNVLNLINETFTPKNATDLTPPKSGEDLTLPQYNFIKPTENIQEKFYEVPENFQMEKVPPSGDPNPIDTKNTKKFMNNVLMALNLSPQPKSQNIDLKPAYDVSTGAGGDLKTADQNDLKGTLDISDTKINATQNYAIPETIDLPKGTINLTPINDEPLIPFANYETPVTTKEKETVWFYAAEEGTDSIWVSATDTLNPDCSQKFNVSPASLCQSMTVSAYDKKSAVNKKGNLPCINEGQMVEFQIDEVTATNGKKLDLSKDKVSTLWTTTDSLGKFAKNGQKTLNTIDQSITYTGKGQVSCEVTSINGITDKNSLCSYSMATCEIIEKCGQLDLKFNEIPLPVASNKITTVDKTKETKETKGAEMTLAITSDKNADYPSSVIWEDTTEGELTFKNPQHVQKLADSFMTKVVDGVETVITIKNYSAKYPEAGMPTLKNAKHEGTVTAKVQGEESVCSAILNVIEVEKIVENVCQVLSPEIQKVGNTGWMKTTGEPTVLSTADNYSIQNTITYSPDVDESLKLVDYKVGTDLGYLMKSVKVGEKPGAENLPQWLVDALGIGDIPYPAGKTEWAKEIKGFPANKPVFFIPAKNLTPGQSYPKAVEITASGSDKTTEAGCTKYIALLVPPSAPGACVSIVLNADKWPPISAKDKVKLSLALGDLGGYTGSFSFSISESSKPYLSTDPASLSGLSSLTVSKDQAFGNGVYLLNPDMDTTWTVSVKADEANTECTGSKAFAPTVTPPPVTPGGGPGGSGPGGGNPSSPPSITKKVAKGEIGKIKDSDWETIINVSGKTGKVDRPDQHVTYKIEYTNGKHKGIKSVLIKDDSIKHGKIQSKGTLGGTLDFEDLKIKIGSDENFKEICEYDDKGKLENDLCITTEGKADDWEAIKTSFKNGEGLVFNNLSDGTKITIFYQMENNTILNDAVCRGLTEKDGCGEEFDNTASFKAYPNNDLGGSEKDKGTTKIVKVIAVCPYILTRASGDVFFESALKTGTDVAYCSPQKNIQAPIITPIEEVHGNPITGGVAGPATLTLPSHDICKYSNVEASQSDNPSDYQNPFKNFSSTICEMKAEVAKDWMKTNVVDQISTNVEKISLWSVAQTSNEINQTPMTSTNGIFKWDRMNLTIDGETQYTISGNTSRFIPAAQTYIIKDADLYINSNIVYEKTQTSWDLKSYPSAAFIVINGNIIIDEDVEQLDGTYIAIDADGTDEKETGKVIAKGGESYYQLTINGSLIGDVSDLFANRKYVGNIAADEGSVTIKYNENFLLNPPPGLNQLMDIKQLEVAY